MVVVDRDDIAIWEQYGPDVANVTTTAVAPQRDRFTPGLAEVGAFAGVDAKGPIAPAVNQTEPSVGSRSKLGGLPSPVSGSGLDRNDQV